MWPYYNVDFNVSSHIELLNLVNKNTDYLSNLDCT